MLILFIIMEGAYGMFKKVISFKNSEEYLYNYLCKQFNPSAFVKQLLKDKMDENNKKDKTYHENNFNNKFNF